MTTKKKKRFLDCTILRRVKITHGTFNIVTGRSKWGKSEIVVEPCGTPLFTDHEIETGICNTCRKGWSVKDNTFASDEEKNRATSSP